VSVVAKSFYDYGLLYGHFYEHGADLNAADEYAYQEMARHFLNDDPVANPDLQQNIRANGDIVRFCAVTDEYAVMSPDGTIKTYFKPIPAHLAPPGTAMQKTHSYRTNQEYFERSST
jgi:hypothetical protein